MTALTRRLVREISTGPGYAAPSAPPSGSPTTTNGKWDVLVGSVPLLLKPSRERPLTRKTGPYRKDQFDATPVPGEQSMVFWWLRSQISFHGGTGILFEEPALEAGTLYSDPLSTVSIPVRYQDSEGVDPWSQPGQISLLKAATQQFTSTGITRVLSGVDANGATMWLQSEGTAVYRCTEGGSKTGLTTGTSNAIQSMTTDGTNYYLADGAVIVQGPLTGGSPGTTFVNGSGNNVVIAWAKGRLIAAIGASLYECVGLTGTALPPPFYTALEPNWVWTAIEPGPDGIYVAGYAGNISKIFYVGLTTGVGNVPILAPAVEVSELPRGELVYSLKSCEDTYMAMGTNLGVRIATFRGGGNGVDYGPLIAKVPAGGLPVYSITDYDRFIYASWGNGMADGTSGLMRIDTGFQVAYQRYAYAKDLRCHQSGPLRSVTMLGSTGRLLFAVDGEGSWLQEPDGGLLEPTGYMQTGNIRFHTEDPKVFQRLKVRTKPLNDGYLKVQLTEEDGTLNDVVAWNPGASPSNEPDVVLSPSLGLQGFVSLTFTLTRSGSDASKGPTMLSYQLKALPAQKNQRLIQLPALIFDFESDLNNTKIGYEGFARERLTQLEALEEARLPVTFQDLSRHPMVSRLCVIDDIEFMQLDPPSLKGGLGGYAMITLRTID